jgi:hypothetical protein
MNASVKLLIGLRMEMCFTRERFHTRRRRNVLMSTTSKKVRTSVIISDLDLALATS